MLLNIFHQKNKTKELKKANRAFKVRSLAILCRISALFYHFLASVAPRNHHTRAFKLRFLAILCCILALFYHFLASVAPQNHHTLIWLVSDEWFWSSTLMIRPKCDKNWSYMLCFSYLVCLPIFKVVLGPLHLRGTFEGCFFRWILNFLTSFELVKLINIMGFFV